MQRFVSTLHAALSLLTLAAVIAQFFLAGLGVFGAEPFNAHRINGYLIGLAAVLLLVLSMIGRLHRGRVVMSAVFVALMVVQIALIESGLPWIEALHPVVALPIMGVSFQLAMRGRAAVFASQQSRDVYQDHPETQASPGHE